MDKILSKSIKIVVSDQIALAAVLYFRQIFVFSRLINKNVLEWFLLKICKEHTLKRSTYRFSRNHPTLCFWLRKEGRQMPNTEQLLNQTDKKHIHQRFSIKALFLKILQYSWENTCMKFLRTSVHGCFWTDFIKCLFGTFSGLHLKQSWPCNITKIPVAFKPKL